MYGRENGETDRRIIRLCDHDHLTIKFRRKRFLVLKIETKFFMQRGRHMKVLLHCVTSSLYRGVRDTRRDLLVSNPSLSLLPANWIFSTLRPAGLADGASG